RLCGGAGGVRLEHSRLAHGQPPMTISAPTTHDAAETGLVETAGMEFAHRRFGPPTGVPFGAAAAPSPQPLFRSEQPGGRPMTSTESAAPDRNTATVDMKLEAVVIPVA